MQLKRAGEWWFRQVSNIILSKIVKWKMDHSEISTVGAGGAVRRAVTGGIKTRLGEVRNDYKKREEAVEFHLISPFNQVRKDYKKRDEEEEWDPEVLALRKEAAMKLDLRDRLERSPRRRVS